MKNEELKDPLTLSQNEYARSFAKPDENNQNEFKLPETVKIEEQKYRMILLDKSLKPPYQAKAEHQRDGSK